MLSWSFVSCDKCIYEDLSTCPLRVQLRYDYNMQYVDRWHREAEDVHLYIFDEAGHFVSEMVNAAAPYEEKQIFELRLNPGNYTIMALCGHRMGTLYKESKLQVGTSTMKDLLVELSRAEDKRIAAELPPLLYGVSKEVKVLGDGSRLIVVPMAKWTNKIRLIMQDVSKGGKSNIKLENYDFRITAPNGRYNGAGEVLSDDVLTYTPYHTESQLKGKIGIAVEFSMLRLLTKQDQRPSQDQRLIITERATGEELLNIDLPSLLLETKFYQNNALSDQEFLDRQDYYAIIFAFDGRSVTPENFLSVGLTINGFVIRAQDHNI